MVWDRRNEGGSKKRKEEKRRGQRETLICFQVWLRVSLREASGSTVGYERCRGYLNYLIMGSAYVS